MTGLAGTSSCDIVLQSGLLPRVGPEDSRRDNPILGLVADLPAALSALDRAMLKQTLVGDSNWPTAGARSANFIAPKPSHRGRA